MEFLAAVITDLESDELCSEVLRVLRRFQIRLDSLERQAVRLDARMTLLEDRDGQQSVA